MSLLFSPLQLGPLALQNRIIIAPMCQYSARDGQASDWHLIHLGSLALSGAALLILEATAVEPRGRISAADLGLWDADCEAALQPIVQSVRRHSAMPLGIQLAHAGRKASTAPPWQGGAVIAPDQAHGWQSLSASALPFHADAPAPKAAEQADIDTLIQAFVDSAQRAVRLGFELIELHAAHGYLLHQFLSPLSNQRSDAYGGELNNRLRLTLQVFDAVKAAIPQSMALGVRVSASDWIEGGWDLPQTQVLAAALDQRGCHYLHVSSGGLAPQQQISIGPGYQLPFASALRSRLRMPVVAVGLITEPQQAEDILQQGQADAVALARGMLYNARWPWHAAAALGAKVEAPPQYLRCEPSQHRGLFADPVTGP